jgi:hypothetical protein
MLEGVSERIREAVSARDDRGAGTHPRLRAI